MERARRRLGQILGREIAPVKVELRDAGRNANGVWAVAHDERITVFTEHLVLARYDLDRLLLHELFHVVHRRAVGAAAYLATPPWMREGAALHVAGQIPDRLDVLAAHAGARDVEAPAAPLVNGLASAPRTFLDYFEDGAAFQFLARSGAALPAVRGLLAGKPVSVAAPAARRFALEEARSRLEPGRAALLRALAAPSPQRRLAALEGIVQLGVYRATIAFHVARTKLELGDPRGALQVVRTRFLAQHRASTLFGEAALLELRALQRVDAVAFKTAHTRALRDLEPYPVYERVVALSPAR